MRSGMEEIDEASGALQGTSPAVRDLGEYGNDFGMGRGGFGGFGNTGGRGGRGGRGN